MYCITLIKHKFKLALATSASLAGAQLVLNRLQAENLFDYVITAEDVEYAKPAPDSFVKAIELMKLEPQQVLIVEDSVAGVQAGLSANAFVVSVREHSTGEQALKIKDDHYIGHYASLNDLYHGLLEGRE